MQHRAAARLEVREGRLGVDEGAADVHIHHEVVAVQRRLEHINGQGGWHGWGGVASAAGEVVTAPCPSACHLQRITAGDDPVRNYAGITGGAFTYSTNIYVPAGTVGNPDFILLNSYMDPAGPYNWSVELLFNLTTNVVYDDLASPGTPSPGSASIPIVRYEWVPISVAFDTVADTFSAAVQHADHGRRLERGSAQPPPLAAVDLYHNAGTGSVYYDNFNLVPVWPLAMLLGLAGLVAGRRRRA